MIFIFYFAGGFLEGFERCSDVNTRGEVEDENYRKFSSSPTLSHVDEAGGRWCEKGRICFAPTLAVHRRQLVSTHPKKLSLG